MGSWIGGRGVCPAAGGSQPLRGSSGCISSPLTPAWWPSGGAGSCLDLCPSICLSIHAGVGDELPAGGTVGLRTALRALPPHGLLPLHRLDLHHHSLQDALSARGRPAQRLLQQLHSGWPGHLAAGLGGGGRGVVPSSQEGPPSALAHGRPRSAASAEQHQPAGRRAAQLHAVPRPGGPRQLVRYPQGLPQPGLHPGA